MNLNGQMREMYMRKRPSIEPKKMPVRDKKGSANTTKQSQEDPPPDNPKPTDTPRRRLTNIEDVIPVLESEPIVSFDQLFGIDYIKEDIVNIVDTFKLIIDNKSKMSRWPVLISGSPGIGKSVLVQAAANYAKLKLVTIPLLRMIRMSRGEFHEALEHLVSHCLHHQPALVLFDNMEQINGKDEFRYPVAEALLRLIDKQTNLLVFCTTSAPLDEMPGITYPFTFCLKRPNTDTRHKILINLKKENEFLAGLDDKSLQNIAANTPSFTALDLDKMLCIAVNKSVGKPTMQHCEAAIDLVKQSFKQGTHLIGEKPAVTWSDIGGMTEVRQAFSDILKQIRRSGRKCKFAGIALYGPPGCGKTMVAQAMANEAGLNFIPIKPAELQNMYLGETEKNIRRVFHEAREHEPCMIYFDEFDGLCGTRGKKDTLTSSIQTLLSEMDGFADRGQSIILASTNRLEDIDPAMKRPGRLSKHIYVGPPDEKARLDILKVITSRPWFSLADDVDLNHWARETKNFTGAELDFLLSQAETKAENELGCDETIELVTLRKEHLEYAMNQIKLENKELDRKFNSIKRTKLE